MCCQQIPLFCFSPFLVSFAFLSPSLLSYFSLPFLLLLYLSLLLFSTFSLASLSFSITFLFFLSLSLSLLYSFSLTLLYFLSRLLFFPSLSIFTSLLLSPLASLPKTKSGPQTKAHLLMMNSCCYTNCFTCCNRNIHSFCLQSNKKWPVREG